MDKKKPRRDIVGKKYTVSDGRMELTLLGGETGRYTVTCANEPGVITEARTIEEAFEMAREVLKELKALRRDASIRQKKEGKRHAQAEAAA